MTLFRLLCIVLGLSLLPFQAMAQADSAEHSKAEIVSKIFEEIPIEEKLNENPRDLHQQFSQNPFGLPADKNQQMMDLFLDSFTADTLIADARGTFHQTFDNESARTTIDWLDNENTQTVLNAEQEFYSLQGVRKRVVNRYELEQNPPSKERIELINTLAESMSASEAEIEAQIILFRAIVSAFGQLNSQQSLSESQIEGFVQNYRSRAQMQINRELTDRFMLIYHGLDSDVLRQYQSFYESEAGNWLSQTTSESVLSAYQNASERFLNSINNL